MNLSGILVIVPPERSEISVARLNALPGVEVYHTEAHTGRIVVVQVAASVHAEVEGLKRIKGLPDIILAEMVYHYFPEDTQTVSELPTDLDELEWMAGAVPRYLNE